MGLDDLINIEKTIKNIGIYIPLFVYGYLFYRAYNIFFLILLILSFILSALYIALKDTLILDVGKDKGKKLAKKVGKWNAIKTFKRISIFYIAWFNLIISLIVLLFELKKGFDIALLVLLLIGFTAFLYRVILLYLNKDRMKEFIYQIRKK